MKTIQLDYFKVKNQIFFRSVIFRSFKQYIVFNLDVQLGGYLRLIIYENFVLRHSYLQLEADLS